MKKVWLSIVLMFSSASYAQGQTESDWKIMPSISVTKLFSLGNRHDNYNIQPLIYPPIGSYAVPIRDRERYSSTGVSFSARFLNGEFEPFALTLSAGANWYGRRDENMPMPAVAFGGPPIVLDSTRLPNQDFRGYRNGFYGTERRGFMSFPVSLGAQAVFPYEKIDKLMLFAGVEGNLHFLSERVYSRRQVEAGFSAVGGIAIKMFEFGVRYSRFAGMNNVGLQAGIRFNAFLLD